MLPMLALLAGFPLPDAAGGWPRVPDDARLEPVFAYVKTTTRNGGLLVVHKGRLIYERYYGKGRREALPNLASCGKSVTSIAIGILIAERPDLFPRGLDQKIFTPRYLPAETFPLDDARKAEIKLGQLLAMTSGLRGNSPGYVRGKPVPLEPPGLDGWQALVDTAALRTPLWCDPGAGYSYATAGVHLASIMLRHVTGVELERYVAEKIAKPLGWGSWGYGYQRPEITHTPGGGGIQLRATDMLRFGYLLLRDGRWGDRQIVSAAYVRHCRRPSPYNPHFPYSLQFDVRADSFFKTGSGGHCLYVVPARDLVIWKLGGRDDQYPKDAPDDGSRVGWKPAVEADQAAQETLRRVLSALAE